MVAASFRNGRCPFARRLKDEFRLILEMPKMRTLNSMLICLLVAVGAAQPAFAQESSPTVWTNDKGNTLEAEFVRLTENAVVLKRDGKEVSVPLKSLSIDSHYQAIKLANPEAFSKPVPKAEIKVEVPALELPKLEFTAEQILKSPFPQNASVDKFLEIQFRELSAGNFVVLWHALPPKLQADVEEVIVKGHQVVGPATVKQVQILLRDLEIVVRDKKEFIFGLPEVAGLGQFKTQLEKAWPLLEGTVSALARPDNWQPNNFQTGQVASWFAKLNMALAPHILAGFEFAKQVAPPGAVSSLMNVDYQVVSQTANTAEVEFRLGSQPPKKKSLQKVGNIWIDVKEVTDGRKSLEAVKARLAQGAGQELAVAKTALPGLIAAVGGLARANTQEEFNEAVGLLRDMTQGFAKNLGVGAMGGPANSGPGNPGPANQGTGGRRRMSEVQGG